MFNPEDCDNHRNLILDAISIPVIESIGAGSPAPSSVLGIDIMEMEIQIQKLWHGNFKLIYDVHLRKTFSETKDGLKLLKTVIAKAGYTGKMLFGMDVAAPELYAETEKTHNMNLELIIAEWKKLSLVVKDSLGLSTDITIYDYNCTENYLVELKKN
ncbi:hypothetical protein C5167_036123 [Papaver somniferum]|nr:hypothetical protein C5167_036123 [Papaver somniferum]